MECQNKLFTKAYIISSFCNQWLFIDWKLQLSTFKTAKIEEGGAWLFFQLGKVTTYRLI